MASPRITNHTSGNTGAETLPSEAASAPADASSAVPKNPSTPPVAAPQTNQMPNSVHTATSDRVGKNWALSEDGLRFIAVCESGVLSGTFMGLPVQDGYILEVYTDSKGHPTVGMGHKVLASDNLKVGEKITVKQAEAFAKKDLAESEKSVNNSVNVPLHQQEYDALVSITFNTGVGGSRKLIAKVNEANYPRRG